jgi:4a-hydroxytetrahydrobiopterin dehydratase
MSALPLREQHCRPLLAGQSPLPADALPPLLGQVAQWQVVDGALERRFVFADFAATMAFVDAVAELSQREDHHPEMRVRWGDCTLRWRTHSVDGLSLNDFICAARSDAIADAGPGTA